MVVQTPTQPSTLTVTQRERPPLESGDHLSRAEFHRRYEKCPEIKKAELIEGVVIVGSPVHRQHGIPHFDFGTVLGVYHINTPGVLASDNQSVILGEENELHPIFVFGSMKHAEKG